MTRRSSSETLYYKYCSYYATITVSRLISGSAGGTANDAAISITSHDLAHNYIARAHHSDPESWTPVTTALAQIALVHTIVIVSPPLS